MHFIQDTRCPNPYCRSGNVTPARAICNTDIHNVSGSGYVPGHGNVYTHGTSKTPRAEAVTYDEPAAGMREVVITMMVWGLVVCLSICITMASVNAGCVIWPVFFVVGIMYALQRRAYYKRAQKNWENKLSHRYYCNSCFTVFQV